MQHNTSKTSAASSCTTNIHNTHLRLIFSCNSSSRVYLAANAHHNERECKIIKRKSALSEPHKLALVDGIAKKHGFAVHLNCLGLLLASEKVSIVVPGQPYLYHIIRT